MWRSHNFGCEAGACARMVLIALGLVSLLMVSFGSLAAPAGNTWAEGRILVQPRAGLKQGKFDEILKRSGGHAFGKMAQGRVWIVKVPPGAEKAKAKALAKHPHVDFAEPDMLVQLGASPNDPKYPSAWHLPKINAPLAWDTSRGAGITVAVLDSGVDGVHPDLASKMVAGRNVAGGNNDTTDINGHGTNVAGVVGASSNNSEGVASVAWDVDIMPIRVTDRTDGWAYWSDIANGLYWAADHGAKVANISYDVNDSGTVKTAAQYFENNGGVTVVAAGNSGDDPGHAASSALVAVSATTSSDTRASWSSFGAYVDVSAPGVSIWTTKRGLSYSAPSGTSFASPTTAGVVALIMAANGSLLPAEVVDVLLNSADDLGDPAWDPIYGAGRINAGAAVQLAGTTDPGEPGDTTKPTTNIVTPIVNEVVSGVVSVAVDASDNVGVTQVEFKVNGQLIGTDITAPYQFAWDSTEWGDGKVNLRAHASDVAGNVGDSDNVVVTVANATNDTTPPVVVITSPGDGDTVGRSVTLSGYANDDVAVAEIKIFVDGRLKCAGTRSVSCGWNTRKVSAGSHTITATATDTAGNQSSVAVEVTVGSSSDKSGKGKGRKNR